MPAKAGTSPGRKGSRFAALIVTDQLAAGRAAVRVRQGQGCPFDVIVLERCEDESCTLGHSLHHVYYLQVKVGGYLPPAERAALLQRAQADGAIPLLAVRMNGGVRYRELLAEPEGQPDDGDDLRDAARDAREGRDDD